MDALQTAADSYEDKTGVKVELVGKSVDDMKDDFIQQVPTGKGPDVVMGAHDWLGELSTNGVVAPIELGDSSEDYLPVALQAATYEGTVYMLRTQSRTSRCCATPTSSRPPRPASTTWSRRATFVVEQGTEGNPYHLYPFQTAFGAPVFGTDDSGSYDPTDLQLGSAGRFRVRRLAGCAGRRRRAEHRRRRRDRQAAVPRRHGSLLADRSVERGRRNRRRHQRRDRPDPEPDR